MPEGQKPWRVSFHREVGKVIAKVGLENTRFSPTLRELVLALKANPKQFPKKHGKLHAARAAELAFQGSVFRAVFVVVESTREVRVLSLDSHDSAYVNAMRRIE